MKTQKSTIRRLRALWYLAAPSDEDLLCGVAALIIPLIFLGLCGGLK